MEEKKAIKINEKLVKIQQELKAPKGQYNKFGNFNYRSSEDILTALKPLLFENGLFITLEDDIKEIAGRVYVVATATLEDEHGERIQTTAYAREPETKKGMDEMQITGATSSYARKYALNGLFAIDDNKDADTNAYNGQSKPATKQKAPAQTRKTPPRPETVTPSEITALKELTTLKGVEERDVQKRIFNDFKKRSYSSLTLKEYNDLTAWLSEL